MRKRYTYDKRQKIVEKHCHFEPFVRQDVLGTRNIRAPAWEHAANKGIQTGADKFRKTFQQYGGIMKNKW